MTAMESSAIHQINAQLKLYVQKQFTGRLDFQVNQHQWLLYLSLGRFVWASGGEHTIRRWRRQLISCCPKVNPQTITLKQNGSFECWDYQILTLLARKQLAQTNEIVAVIQGVVAESLFDIVQDLTIEHLKKPEQEVSLHLHPHLGFRPSNSDSSGILPRTWTLQIPPTLTQVEQEWKQWESLGLKRFSPNLVPSIRAAEQLKQKTSEKVYKNLVTLMNGQRTLRDISMLMKRDVYGLTKSLLPYIKQKWIGLEKVPDLPSPAWVKELDRRVSKVPQSSSQSPVQSKTIVCIDDSPQTCTEMKTLLTKAGHQCMTVQDPVQALPTLIQQKPDLVFLDLVMPIANGYEICTQIRRVSSLQEIPVIILTGNDGIVDRVRAKMVGASDFLSKPIDAKQVLGTLERYILNSPTSMDEN